MRVLFDQITYAIRAILKRPLPATMAVIALTLGIGVNISCFISIDALVFKALPYGDVDRILTLWESDHKDPVSPANFRDWREQNTSFEQLAAYRVADAGLILGGAEPERVQTARVTSNFFAALGRAPAMGRGFSQDQEQPGRDQAVIVSDSFWRGRMSASPGAIGSEVSLGGRNCTVVGVMPAEFDFPLGTNIWVPLALSPNEWEQRASGDLMVVGRLREGVAPARAEAELDIIARRLAAKYPATNRGRGIAITPLRELHNQVSARFALMLAGAGIFVLLLACANVANIQLVLAAERQTEMAIRSALGASRWRLVYQMLTEALLVAMVAGGAGLYLADANLAYNRQNIPAAVYKWVPGLQYMRVTPRTIAFALAASVLAGLICALPAILHILKGTHGDSLNDILKEGGKNASGGVKTNRLRAALVASEVGLALVLLVGAGLMVDGFKRILVLDPGFNTRDLLVFEMAGSKEYFERLLKDLKSVPGVASIAASAGGNAADGIYIEGRAEPLPSDLKPRTRGVTAGYLSTLQLPVQQGRQLEDRDETGATNSIVISDSVAKFFWPRANPVGQRLRLWRSQKEPFTVVGVSGDTKEWFGGKALPTIYLASASFPVQSMTILARAEGDAGQVANALRWRVKDFDAAQPPPDIKTMDQIVSEETSGVRIAATTMSEYALIALLLAVTGIYAVSSYLVGQRKADIGIAVALGASSADVVRMFLKQTARMTAVGLFVGLIVAYGLARVMASATSDIVPLDYGTFAIFTFVLAVCAMSASYLPARRAAVGDPMRAIHHE